MNESAKSTAVSQASKRLREMILERGDGAFLGSREDLVRELGTGQVTLQQASRLLERERLLTVKRGPSGGYFARWPDEGGVEETVAIYLRAKNAGYREAYPIAAVLGVEMARLAARSLDESGREGMAGLRDEIVASGLGSPEEVTRLEGLFTDLLFRLANNALGELILLVTRRIYREDGPGSLLSTVEDMETWRRTRLAMIQAILDHDEDIVQLLGRRFYEWVSSLLEARMPRGRERL